MAHAMFKRDIKARMEAEHQTLVNSMSSFGEFASEESIDFQILVSPQRAFFLEEAGHENQPLINSMSQHV